MNKKILTLAELKPQKSKQEWFDWFTAQDAKGLTRVQQAEELNTDKRIVRELRLQCGMPARKQGRPVVQIKFKDE